MGPVPVNGTHVVVGNTRRAERDPGPPFEMKFLVSESRAAEVAEWAARHLRPDPHAGPSRDDGYRVTSLYLDTPSLDVYHRRGSFGRAKYRVRRYDAAPWLFLERKCKVKGRVQKRRTQVDDGELALLRPPQPTDGWKGRWFGHRLELRRLSPCCLVSYERVASVGVGPHGPIRLTIDRQFLCRPGTSLEVPALSGGHVLFAGQGVVELKFRLVMPALFKRLCHDLELVPARASKYRSAVAACGLLPERAAVHSRSEGEVGDA